MAKRVHIVVVEPSAIIRFGIVGIMQQSTSINADIIDVSDLSTYLNGTYSQVPDLLIINPLCLGLFSPSQLRDDVGNSQLKIVALQSSFVDQSLLHSYDGVLTILDSVETVMERVVELNADEGDEVDRKRELSAREKEIIVSVVKGLTNKQIADHLNLSAHTVIAHRRNIASKLNIHSPSGLTVYAIVNKLVNMSDIKNTISQKRELV